jgi:hypothetical protein
VAGLVITDAGIDAFVRLFRGRGDIFAQWANDDFVIIRQPLKREHFARHLVGPEFLGVYPNLGNKCSWGCIDIDFDDWELAFKLQKMAAYKEIQLWCERTVKGYHLWCFPDDFVHPDTMRRALMAVCKASNYDPKEVNPKQGELPKGGVGNWVRLPYPGGEHAVQRQFIATATLQPMTARDNLFLEIDRHGRTFTEDLEQTAELWTPPVVEHYEGYAEDPLLNHEYNALPRLAKHILSEGVLDGSDRSGTLYKLAALCAAEGVERTIAYKAVVQADQTWG